ncbi:MAG: hypothetical protein HY939_05160 [Gammaproteobacteria bacterium]|nr:hypothetical protein [Gammaproteobacteria bacterium]
MPTQVGRAMYAPADVVPPGAPPSSSVYRRDSEVSSGFVSRELSLPERDLNDLSLTENKNERDVPFLHNIRLKDVLRYTYAGHSYKGKNLALYTFTGWDEQKPLGGGATLLAGFPVLLFNYLIKKLYGVTKNETASKVKKGFAGLGIAVLALLGSPFYLLLGAVAVARTVFSTIKNALKAVAELLPLTFVALTNHVQDRYNSAASSSAKVGWGLLRFITLVIAVPAAILHIVTHSLFSPVSAATEAYKVGRSLFDNKHAGRFMGGLLAGLRFAFSIALLAAASIFLMPIILGMIAEAIGLGPAVAGINFLAQLQLPVLGKIIAALKGAFANLAAAINNTFIFSMATGPASEGAAFLGAIGSAIALFVHRLMDLVKPKQSTNLQTPAGGVDAATTEQETLEQKQAGLNNAYTQASRQLSASGNSPQSSPRGATNTRSEREGASVEHFVTPGVAAARRAALLVPPQLQAAVAGGAPPPSSSFSMSASSSS